MESSGVTHQFTISAKSHDQPMTSGPKRFHSSSNLCDIIQPQHATGAPQSSLPPPYRSKVFPLPLNKSMEAHHKCFDSYHKEDISCHVKESCLPARGVQLGRKYSAPPMQAVRLGGSEHGWRKLNGHGKETRR